MSYKELTPENLSSNQAKYFQPSKALPYKDYIIDKSLQGLTPREIHKKLLGEFPEADVSLDSLKRFVKKHNKNNSKTKAKTNEVNKSQEVRKLVKEMICDGVELNGSNIIKTLANRGIIVSYTHVTMAIGQAVINNEVQFTQTPLGQQTPKLIKENPALRKLVKEMICDGGELNGSNIIKTLANRGIVVSYSQVVMAIGQLVINNEVQFPKLIKENPAQCSFDDLLVARELIEKLGGLNNALNVISAYAKFTK